VLRLVEPVTLFSSALGAGIDQWRNAPPEWGQGSEGYARRFASAEGFTAAHNAIGLGFDLAFHLDPRYRRLSQAGFMPRLRNAVSQTFIANKDDGGKMINVSEIAGNFGAGFIANSWQPAGYNRAGDGLTRGAFGLAYHTLKNVAREFLPDLLHPLKRGAFSVLDLTMPGMTGFEALVRLKQEPAAANIPVIIVTSCVLSERAERVDERSLRHFKQGRHGKS
jgi:CheY-like chemotaxis protein